VLTRARLAHEARTIEITDALRADGVALRVLKGPALARLDYPDPQLRPTGDLDLLVRGEQLATAVARLRALGGTQTDPDPVPGYGAHVGKGATVTMPDGFEVDLHRLLVWGPLGVRVHPDQLWARARPVIIGGRELETLAREETLVHAALHLVVGGHARAMNVRDVAQLLAAPALDPDEVLAVARRWDAEAALATAIVLTSGELGSAVGHSPLTDWAEAYVPRWRDRTWLRVERPGAPLPAVEVVATWLELPDARSRSMLVRATVSPAHGTWPSPTVRLRRLAGRFGRFVSGPVP
jgi:hypothetical protein